MALQSRWAAVRFRIIVLVNGISFEGVQVVCSYELNAIPTCSITIAVGRNVRTLQAATAHSRVGKLKNRNYVEVFLLAEPLGEEGGAPNEWPADEFPIFYGYVTGTGWQRSTSGANFVIHAEHWLSELNYSSAITGASHPGNPAAFTYPAGFDPPAIGAGGGTSVHWTYHLQLEGGVDAAQAESDFWENVLKPWSIQVAKKDPIDLRLKGIETPKGNDGALDILEGNGDFKIVSEKLSMDLDGPDSLAIGNSLARSLEKSMGSNVVNTTLWGKIVGEWSPSYWFSVVPRVEDTLIVPFVGALGPDRQFLEVKAGDYVQCDLHAAVPQQLCAIGINHPIEWLCGANTDFAFLDEEKGGLAAVYPTPPKKKGVILLKDCPMWIADAVQGYVYGRGAEGVQPRVPIRTAGDADNVGEDNDPPRDPNDNEREFRDVIMRFAQHWYILEQLKGRTGELSGRLRFDLAPGSQIKVEAGQDPFIGQADALSQPFFASVSKVTHLINAEVQRAGTSFTLAHIRNEEENKDPDTSIEIPPLYKEPWTGKVLLDEFTPGA
jgi:hypothetical protein